MTRSYARYPLAVATIVAGKLATVTVGVHRRLLEAAISVPTRSSERRPASHELRVESGMGRRKAARLQAMLAHEGAFFPGEFAVPMFRASIGHDGRPLWQECTFVGTATLLGGDLLLSARHVLDAAFSSQGEEVPMVAIASVEHSRVFLVRILHYEPHPEVGCDVAIARTAEWDARPQFAGFASIAPPNEVFSVGCDVNSLASLRQGDLGAFNRPRYLRGYVTRGLDTTNDDFSQISSFEVSFPFWEGMSGSPVWGYDYTTGERALIGIAIGTQSHTVGANAPSRGDDESAAHISERVVDYGVAIRLVAVLDWKIKMLGGWRLGELLPNNGSGRVPPRLLLESGLAESADGDGWPDDDEG